jgi:hypothetical protein
MMNLLAEEINTSSRSAETIAVRASSAAISHALVRRGQRVNVDIFDHPSVEHPTVRATSTWQEYATKILWAIAADSDTRIDYRRANLYLRVLGKIMESDTIYPFMTPDYEGGMVFEWSAGVSLIELDIEVSGEYFLLHTVDSQAPIIQQRGRVSELDIPSLKALLSDFSRQVSAHNPAWRELFA